MNTLRMIFISAVLCALSALSASAKCAGKERWDVKVLTDSVASNINFKAVPTTIKSLVERKVPAHIGDDRHGIEFRTHTVTCKIGLFKKEYDDSDYHLVLVDPTSRTMIAEIPDPNCESVKDSPWVDTFRDVRHAFEQYIVGSGHVQPGYYKITGVAFFDYLHGQTGVAPNGIELHPILSISKVP